MDVDMSFRDEEHRRELWQFIRDVSEVEEIPVSSIVALANAHVIDITKYHEAWEALCEQAWLVVEVAEDRLEVIG